MNGYPVVKEKLEIPGLSGLLKMDSGNMVRIALRSPRMSNKAV